MQSWRAIFERGGEGYVPPPGHASPVAASSSSASAQVSSSAFSATAINDVLNVNQLIRAYQVRTRTAFCCVAIACLG